MLTDKTRARQKRFGSKIGANVALLTPSALRHFAHPFCEGMGEISQ